MSPANESIPYREPGSSSTAKASGAIVGKRFVKIGGNRTGGGGPGGVPGGGISGLSTDTQDVYVVKQCDTSGEAAFGVSKHDVADGGIFGVHTGSGIVVPITAGADLTAGTEVQSDAAGKAIPLVAPTANVTTGAVTIPRALGYVLNGAASGTDAEIELY